MAMNLLLALALGMTAVATQNPPEDQRQSLADIPALQVKVAALTQDAMADGLRVNELKADMGLKLRSAGIKVDDESAPYLYALITYRKSLAPQGWDIGSFGDIIVTLQQPVIVIANGEKRYGATWMEHVVFNVLPGEGAEFVRASLRNIMDNFINDYFAVNPLK
jgi:hypothetical protein